MVRPPCCDKVGIKKGPWTPEEDIILVSYIQEHGPGNWRSVPTNTGLLRCSKSCRLRWTNYLRPGIKRGNFTSHEEGMIIHLQALLGNKWAAIASYLPQRTDNDIKNYWNTHLKKKIKKLHSNLDPPMSSNPTTYQFVSKGFNGDVENAHENGKTSPSVYASSAENISRLLEGWMRSSVPKNEDKDDIVWKDEFELILSFDHNFNGLAWEKDYGSNPTDHMKKNNIDDHDHIGEKAKLKETNINPPLSFLENWILDETIGEIDQQVMELPSIF